jgi:hypothetical protein
MLIGPEAGVSEQRQELGSKVNPRTAAREGTDQHA